MKMSYHDIKKITKERVNSRFGDALLITLIPGILVTLVMVVIGGITEVLFTDTSFLIDQMIQSFLGIFSSYIIIYMMIEYCNGKDGFSFNGVFSDKKMLLNYVFLNLILGFFSLLAFLPLIEPILSLFEQIAVYSDPDALATFIVEEALLNEDLLSALWLSLGLLFLVSLIMVKFIFAEYLVIDQKLGIFESMKKSWKMTNGNYFRVLFFPFTFFFWMLLAIITCGVGLIYVIPLITAGQTFLYIVINQEHDGNDINNFTANEPKEEIDPLSYDYYN